jgi:hypothetical protein
MTKSELLESFEKDFKKTQGALSEILEHNRAIDGTLVEELMQGDHNKLEEHIEISKIIMDGVKGFNDLYSNAPKVLEGINKIPGKDDNKDKKSLADLMCEIEE